MDAQVLADQQELIYKSSVRRQEVVWKPCGKRQMKETKEKRELGKSVQAARHDDDECWNVIYL